MDRLDPKQLGFVIYLGLRMHQFQKSHLLRVAAAQYNFYLTDDQKRSFTIYSIPLKKSYNTMDTEM